jgi:inner membrane transporter RhtA
VAVTAAALGVVLVSGVLHTSLDRLDLVGVGFAALAGVMWAAYIVLSQRTGRAFGGLDGLALALIVSTVAVAPLGLTSVDRWTLRDIALGLGIAVLSSVLPYSLELVALRHLAQHVFGILLSLEPVVAALAGFVVLHQTLEMGQVAGMALVVLASAIVLGARSRPETPDAALGPG